MFTLILFNATNDKQRAELAMFQTTLRVFGEHADAYAANKALTTAVVAFQAEVDVLDPENLAQRPESGGLTAVKKKIRLRVDAAAHNIGAALYAHAADPAHEDLPLQAAVDYTQRTLGRKPAADLVRLCRLLVLHRPRPQRSSLPHPCRQLTDLLFFRIKYISQHTAPYSVLISIGSIQLLKY